MNIYFTTEEQKRIRSAATKLGVSGSYVVRLLIRDALGLSTGISGQSEVNLVKADMSKSGHRGPRRATI